MADLPKLWALVKADLLRARNLLSDASDDVPNLQQYSEFVEHNELELAWASQIDPASLIFEGKCVEGFWLTAWLRRRNLLSQPRVTRHVQQMLAGDLKTEIQARLPLKEIAHGLEQYVSNMTGGKILLLP